MNYLKGRSNTILPTHTKLPYSRPNNQGIFKNPNRPSTSVSHGRTFVPAKPSGLGNSYLNLYECNRPSLSIYDEVNDSVNENHNRHGESFKSRTGEFRPRKSQLENKSVVPFQELETMSLRNNADAMDYSRFTKFRKTSLETSESFQIKVRENSLRIFSGSVANLYQWSKLREKFCILFEVRAILENVQTGKWPSEKVLHLSDSKAGPRMQVLYYEIDRPLPQLPMNSVVRCIGRLLTRNRLQAFKVEEISEEERNDSQRLSFICNRVAEELTIMQQKQ